MRAAFPRIGAARRVVLVRKFSGRLSPARRGDPVCCADARGRPSRQLLAAVHVAVTSFVVVISLEKMVHRAPFFRFIFGLFNPSTIETPRTRFVRRLLRVAHCLSDAARRLCASVRCMRRLLLPARFFVVALSPLIPFQRSQIPIGWRWLRSRVHPEARVVRRAQFVRLGLPVHAVLCVHSGFRRVLDACQLVVRRLLHCVSLPPWHTFFSPASAARLLVDAVSKSVTSASLSAVADTREKRSSGPS